MSFCTNVCAQITCGLDYNIIGDKYSINKIAFLL